jgi:hypothetical protein
MYVKELLSSRSFSLDATSSPRLAAPHLSCAPSLRRLADQASSSSWLLRRKNHNIFREYTEEEKSSFESTHSSGRKEGRKDRRISVILHETQETLKS